VEVSPLTKKQLKWSVDYKKVPIAVFARDKQVVPDSAAIADALLERFGNPPGATGTFADDSARKWAEWATSKLAVRPRAWARS